MSKTLKAIEMADKIYAECYYKVVQENQTIAFGKIKEMKIFYDKAISILHQEQQDFKKQIEERIKYYKTTWSRNDIAHSHEDNIYELEWVLTLLGDDK